MDVSKTKASNKVATRTIAPGSPHKGPPKFKQRSTRQFKSKPPKKGVIGYKYFLCFNFFSYLFIWIFYGFACCICANINVAFIRFGEDIPGMEGLGTGMYNF